MLSYAKAIETEDSLEAWKLKAVDYQRLWRTHRTLAEAVRQL